MAARTEPHEHIRVMEQRIREQIERVEQLERSGKDPAAEKGRLELLQRALDEMRFQLGQLSPTGMDEKRMQRPTGRY